MHRADLQQGVSTRLLRDALSRPRLEQGCRSQLTASALILDAPSGYGKSVLLAQVRRDALSRGDAVVSLESVDLEDADAILSALSKAIAEASDTRAVAAALGGAQLDSPGGRADHLLGVWAGLGRRLLVLIDDFDAITPGAARDLILRLCVQAPVNGNVVLACRAGAPLELRGRSEIAIFSRTDLAFTLPETIELLRSRADGQIGLKAVARLHDRCEGWPAAVGVAASTVRQAPDPTEVVESLSRPLGQLDRLLVGSADAVLPAEVRDFLREIAPLEALHPDLCARVTGRANAGQLLEDCRERTPLLVETDSGFLRLHRLAAPLLCSQWPPRPADEQIAYHRTASVWFAEQGRWEAAAEHALAAGDPDGAVGFIDRVLVHMITTARFEAIARWADRDPRHGPQKRRAAQVAQVMRLAIDGRAHEARDLARDLAIDLGRFDAELAQNAAALLAFHQDDPDAAVDAVMRWPELETLAPRLKQVGRNLDLWLQSLGATRRGAASVPDAWHSGATDLPDAMGLHCLAIGMIDAGQLRHAARLLLPALQRHERVFVRRDIPANVLAATSAAVLWGMDEREQARDVMVGRTDLLERFANMPDAMRFGFATAARMAAFDGNLAGAVSLLDRQLALADSVGLIRIQIVAILELIRTHVVAGVTSEARGLVRRLDSLLEDGPRIPDAYRSRLQGLVALARGRVLMAGGAYDVAGRELEAAAGARLMRVDSLELSLVRAGLAVRCEEVEPQLHGVIELALSLGSVRLLVDADPALHELLIRQGGEISPKAGAQLAHAARPDMPAGREANLHGPILTSKEEEVLKLLGSGLSNKDIARALEISAETVKWHVKNLGIKLEIGGRRGIVNRSRMLGLLMPA